MSPGNTMWLGQLGQAYAMAGNMSRAREILCELGDRAQDAYVSPYHFAYVYAGLGEADRAMDWLERAVAERTGPAYGIKGSFLLGAILRYGVETPTLTPELRAFLTLGVCGGYTTFSTFSYEAVALLEDGEWGRAGMYIGLSLLLSIGATFLGFALARQAIAW